MASIPIRSSTSSAIKYPCASMDGESTKDPNTAMRSSIAEHPSRSGSSCSIRPTTTNATAFVCGCASTTWTIRSLASDTGVCPSTVTNSTHEVSKAVKVSMIPSVSSWRSAILSAQVCARILASGNSARTASFICKAFVSGISQGAVIVISRDSTWGIRSNVSFACSALRCAAAVPETIYVSCCIGSPPSKHMQTRPLPGTTHSPYFPEIGGMCPLSHIHFELHVYLA